MAHTDSFAQYQAALYALAAATALNPEFAVSRGGGDVDMAVVVAYLRGLVFADRGLRVLMDAAREVPSLSRLSSSDLLKNGALAACRLALGLATAPPLQQSAVVPATSGAAAMPSLAEVLPEATRILDEYLRTAPAEDTARQTFEHIRPVLEKLKLQQR